MKNNFFLLGALCIIPLFCASCTARDTNDTENRLSSNEDSLDSVKSSSESSDTSNKGEQNYRVRMKCIKIAVVLLMS